MHVTHLLTALFLFLLLLCPMKVSGSTLRIDYQDHALSVSTKDVDLKTLLLRLNKEVGISVWFPKTLNRKLTIKLSGVSVERALKAILKGLSYATIYSRSGKNAKARISEVHVYKGSKRRTPMRNAVGNSYRHRIERRIDNYEKRLKSAQDRLDRAESGSASERRYKRRIRSYKRIISRLRQQIR